ncbi:patatin-like phospholipase family protein [Sulfurovum sp.]|uniref:patatin-like phospholipase family protein n=1 Tax=Sulfurovum sp. TaxID=1969726 RepID=UPI0028683369|nr:patatin-like phospholipase family protein [Sulfurovum sp.]
MYKLLKLSLIFSLFTLTLHAQPQEQEREKLNLSMVLSGGVSLGAYQSGYNWAMIKMLSKMRDEGKLLEPDLRSIAGASAGSINSLLSAMYWCQKDSVPLHNSVDDNLFYETWVNLGIEDLVIKGKDPTNKNSLFTRRGLQEKGDTIIEHLKKPIFRKGCEVPLGVSVTKVRPIVENISGIKVKNQNFSVPLVFKEKNGQGIVENTELPKSTAFYISIPGIEKDRQKLVNLLFASGAFPGAFQQVKLDYKYKGGKYSHYFIDGGLYDNVPLDLAIALDQNASHFLFMDPSNIRKEIVVDETDAPEELPVGFITTNLIPVFSSFGIMQSMKLYDAINKNFREDSTKKLILSSRYHPITGKFLGHFGAFLDQNFRTYDYYVGVYDAIYHLATALKKNYEIYAVYSKVQLMNRLKTRLGLDNNPEALAAYKLFLNTEFNHIKPKTTDRFSAIYNSFDIEKPNEKRYSNDEFKSFLTKLDMHYLKTSENSFLAYAKEDIDNWYKRPLRFIVNRITTLENDRAEIYPDHAGIATITSIGAWTASSSLKDKNGFHFLPLDVPQDEGLENFRTALRLLPNEITTDLNNGGMSLGYSAFYYNDKMPFIDGAETKASYIIADKTANFMRIDLSAFKEYDDFIKFGGGASFFGDMEGSFYKRESAFGANAYVDIVDIFRLTYVYRDGDKDKIDHNYLYFGIENVPSLIYWLNR